MFKHCLNKHVFKAMANTTLLQFKNIVLTWPIFWQNKVFSKLCKSSCDYLVLKYLPINRIPDEKQLMSVTEKLANELEEQSKQLDELRENV